MKNMSQQQLMQFQLFNANPQPMTAALEILPDSRINGVANNTKRAGRACLLTGRQRVKTMGAIDIKSASDGRATRFLQMLRPPYLDVFWMSLQGALVYFEKNGEIQALTNAELVVTGLREFGHFYAIEINKKQKDLIKSHAFQLLAAAYNGKFRKEHRAEMIKALEEVKEEVFKSGDFTTCMKVLFSTSERTIHYDRKG